MFDQLIVTQLVQYTFFDNGVSRYMPITDYNHVFRTRYTGRGGGVSLFV